LIIAVYLKNNQESVLLDVGAKKNFLGKLTADSTLAEKIDARFSSGVQK